MLRKARADLERYKCSARETKCVSAREERNGRRRQEILFWEGLGGSYVGCNGGYTGEAGVISKGCLEGKLIAGLVLERRPWEMAQKLEGAVLLLRS